MAHQFSEKAKEAKSVETEEAAEDEEHLVVTPLAPNCTNNHEEHRIGVASDLGRSRRRGVSVNTRLPRRWPKIFSD